jgi:hypothetical protein
MVERIHVIDLKKSLLCLFLTTFKTPKFLLFCMETSSDLHLFYSYID